ncbi:sugar transferase [Tomitella gaofuii]|uniref:sugar transferase n=1 Tax=Tomitella gaofuii TaxID=2760083 RepID=UPI0015F91388|nr:sugar transferase [Tomitella gaofuii]
MPFRGFFRYAGTELANTSRVVDHLRTPLPTHDATRDQEMLAEGPRHLYKPTDVFELAFWPHTFERPPTLQPDTLAHTYVPSVYDAAVGPAEEPYCGCKNTLTVGYDDSWADLKTWLHDGGSVYRPSDAPWFNPSVPASAEFIGIWVMAVDGLDSLPVDRKVDDAICGGGVAGPVRTPARAVDFDALVVGCTNAGARYGMAWLSRTLREVGRSGGDLTYLDAHPGDTSSEPDDLERILHRVILTSPPTVDDRIGLGGSSQHRQATVFRTSFTMTALDPWAWGRAHGYRPSWTETTVGVTWGHAPDCDQPESCPTVPTLLSTECRVTPIDMRVPPIPVCGGCQPLCEVTRRVWQIPEGGEEIGVTLTVSNNNTTPLSLTGYIRPCGVDSVCDEMFPIAIRGLPVGGTVVADAALGRAYGVSGGERTRQVGIVSTPNGAPWQPPILDGYQCWELVVDTAPGTMVDMEVTIQERLS